MGEPLFHREGNSLVRRMGGAVFPRSALATAAGAVLLLGAGLNAGVWLAVPFAAGLAAVALWMLQATRREIVFDVDRRELRLLDSKWLYGLHTPPPADWRSIGFDGIAGIGALSASDESGVEHLLIVKLVSGQSLTLATTHAFADVEEAARALRAFTGLGAY